MLNYSPYFRISATELTNKLQRLKGVSEIFGNCFTEPKSNKEIVSSVVNSIYSASEGGLTDNEDEIEKVDLTTYGRMKFKQEEIES